jgi:hypothetical protein
MVRRTVCRGIRTGIIQFEIGSEFDHPAARINQRYPFNDK